MEVKLSDGEEVFKCVLCGTDSDLNSVLAHLISTHHRLSYLNHHFPTVGRKFSASSTPSSQWQLAILDTLDTVVRRIEARFGRGEPSVVSGLLSWETEATRIKQKIFDGLHAR